jgi:tetratricopeptide (TPR) repeat protein
MHFRANPGNDAYATIRGFVFQANLTVLQWLTLSETEHLELECGEDIDVVGKAVGDAIGQAIASGEPPVELVDVRRLDQLKVRAANLTLKSGEALQAIARFCEHQKLNPQWSLSFRYVTTAELGVEQDWNGSGSAIITWESIRLHKYGEAEETAAVGLIATFLRSCSQPDKVSKPSWDCMRGMVDAEDTGPLLNLIRRLEWSSGHGDYLNVMADIKEELAGRDDSRSAEEIDRLYEHLFTYVFLLLCRAGKKTLTAASLTAELSAPSVSQEAIVAVRSFEAQLQEIDRRLTAVEHQLEDQSGRVEGLEGDVATINAFFDLAKRSAEPKGNLSQLIENIKTINQQASEAQVIRQNLAVLSQSLGQDAGFAIGLMSISTDPPELVNPSLSRKALVDSITEQLQAGGIVVLRGEVGSGKTQLLKLIVQRHKGKTRWLNIPRSAGEVQARALLDLLVASETRLPKGIPSDVWAVAVAKAFRGSLLIIDDLPAVPPGGELAARLQALAKAFRNSGAQLLCSTYHTLPSAFEQRLGFMYVEAPRFTRSDVGDLFALLDAPPRLTTDAILDLIVTISEGLPILVTAAVRYLADQAWDFSSEHLEALLKGEFAEGVRADASQLLQTMVPDAAERELLIRLSLAVGPFSLEEVARVARVPRTIPLPGEKVQRARGIWLQPLGSDRYLRSPLITAKLGSSLDPKTFRGVHFVLGRNLLARKVLEPADVLVCVNHFTLSGSVNQAYIVLIQALAELSIQDEPLDEGFGLIQFWTTYPLPPGGDLNLQLYLKALQLVVTDRQGTRIDRLVGQLDALIDESGSKGWGVAMAAGHVAIHMAHKNAALANRFLVPAINQFNISQFPTGGVPLPPAEYPLEGVLWITAVSSRSDEDVYSWLEAVSRYTPAQIETLNSSNLAEDNVTILCDGVWRREYDKPESERDWDHSKAVLARIEGVARAIPYPLLEAAAIRNRIVILAEWEQQVAEALDLAQAAISRLPAEDCIFLIAEVIGRQLHYAGRSAEGAGWLERALDCNAYRFSLWRRNVLITLAEICGPSDRSRAADLTGAAVALCRNAGLIDTALIEALVEHSMALWNNNRRVEAFQTLEEAVSKSLETEASGDTWKGMFARVFGVAAYYSGIALNGKPQAGHVEPTQGLFLGSSSEATTAFRSTQLPYVCLRLAMYAEGIGDPAAAARWSLKAMEYAEIYSDAMPAVRASQGMGLADSLMRNDFRRSAEIVIAMATIELPTQAHLDSLGQACEALTPVRNVLESNLTPQARLSILLVPVIAATLKLALLKLDSPDSPANETMIEEAIQQLEAIPAAHPAPEPYIAAIRASLLGDANWEQLHQWSVDSAARAEYRCTFIYMTGTILRAPLRESLYSQIWLVRQLEQGFRSHPSIIREVVAPFFIRYWDRACNRSAFEFRVRPSYAKQQVGSTEKSFPGLRRLFKEMRFCLGAPFPDDVMAWLDRA